MRLAVVTTSFPSDEGDPSGHFVRAEVRQLERDGHDVTVVAPAAGRAFGWPGVWARVRARPLRVLEAGAWVARARVAVAHLDVDRVIAHWALPSAWPIATGARSGELEVVSHGADVRLLLTAPAPLRDRVVRRIAARACAWRFVSASLKDALVAAVALPTRERLRAIALVRPSPIELPGVDVAVADRRAQFGTARVAVSVGRLVRSKRVDRTIAHVARTRDVDLLVVVGDGPERPRLERLARALGVDARFVGVVPRSDALAWIGAAHCLFQASDAEGLSTVVREADMLGTPVVRIRPDT